jgi:hypothetical protein
MRRIVLGRYPITEEVRGQGTEDRMVCRLWRNYLLSGLAGSVFIVGCGCESMNVYLRSREDEDYTLFIWF